MTPPSFDAVVLAGGRSRRMGGGDKTRADVGGASLLDRVLEALAEARRVVVVGEERPVARAVEWALEQPPGGGPGAGLVAGLALVTADVVVVCAADLPFLTADAVRRLVRAVADAGAVAVDAGGREQWLCSAWRTDVLVGGAWAGAGGSVRGVMSTLPFTRVSFDADAVAPWLDCDTPEDLRRARELT
jgi:molybdopterin-guanine dinucleotide biosynthesis protein A